ncbi:MAG: glycosyltransferase family 4 protein [Gammaproteobacteria bacterium]
MSKVLVLASYAPSLIRFRGHLLRGMVARGHAVYATAPDDSETAGQLGALGVTFRPVELHRTGINPLQDARYLARVCRLISELKPDVVLAYTAKPVIWGLLGARLLGVPDLFALITGLGYAFSGRGPRRWLFSTLLSFLYRFALSGCSVVFFQNPDDHQEFVARKLLKRGQCAEVVNGSGVDMEVFRPQVLPGKNAFLLIARLLVDKGIREYVAAARLVKDKCQNVSFQLAGWRDTNPAAVPDAEIEAWISGQDIEYLGVLEDVRPALANADVYVLPSYREGLPRTVLEAMASGRPIITTDVPGCRETVRNGENGYLVPPRNVPALVDAMLRFVDNPQLVAVMGAASRRQAEERFDANHVSRSMLDRMGL